MVMGVVSGGAVCGSASHVRRWTSVAVHVRRLSLTVWGGVFAGGGSALVQNGCRGAGLLERDEGHGVAALGLDVLDEKLGVEVTHVFLVFAAV